MILNHKRVLIIDRLNLEHTQYIINKKKVLLYNQCLSQNNPQLISPNASFADGKFMLIDQTSLPQMPTAYYPPVYRNSAFSKNRSELFYNKYSLCLSLSQIK